MPGQMMTNYLGKAINGLGRGSGMAYMYGRKGADMALAHGVAKYAVPAGLAMAGAMAMGNNHPVIGAALMGAGGYVGARGLASGAYGAAGGWGGPGGKMSGYMSRMRERGLGMAGNLPMDFRAGAGLGMYGAGAHI